MSVHVLHLLLALQAASSHPVPAGVTGTIRDLEDGRILHGVVVEAGEARRWTVSDSLGRYRIAGLSPGPHQLRFRAAGHLSLQLVVRVPDSTIVHLDVELAQAPVRLPPLVAVRPERRDDELDTEAQGVATPLWALHAMPAREEPHRALVLAAGAAVRGDGSGSIHLEGGEADEVLLTLDGFPVYGATHFGSARSAVNPDAIGELAVRPGAVPGPPGDGPGGTIDVRTSLLGGGAAHGRGAATPEDVRQLVRGGLAGGRGRYLVSARRSHGELFDSDGVMADDPVGYDDWLGAASSRLGSGHLHALVFRAENALAAPSRREGTGGGDPAANAIEWESFTDGIAWEQAREAGIYRIEAWRAGTATEVEWHDPSSPVRLESRFQEIGLRAASTWSGHRGALTAGLDVRRLDTRYDARMLAGVGPAAPAPRTLEFSVTPTIVSASLRLRTHPAPPLGLDVALRASRLAGRITVEPRLAARFALSDALVLSASAGRAYRFVQSLRNDETFLSAVLGFDVPIAAGAGDAARSVPAVRTDRLAAGLELRAAPGLTFGLESYARRLASLLLAAPSSTQPFVSTAVGTGSGRAAGVTARAAYARGPLELAAALGAAEASRRVGAESYVPGFHRSWFLAAALVFRPDRASVVGVSVGTGAGQWATPVIGIDWRPYVPFGGEAELSGTPVNLDGRVNAHRLPPLRRVDIGARRDWRLPWWSSGPVFRASVAIENLLNHRNALGIAVTADGRGRELLRSRPRSLYVELGWAF